MYIAVLDSQYIKNKKQQQKTQKFYRENPPLFKK